MPCPSIDSNTIGWATTTTLTARTTSSRIDPKHISVKLNLLVKVRFDQALPHRLLLSSLRKGRGLDVKSITSSINTED